MTAPGVAASFGGGGMNLPPPMFALLYSDQNQITANGANGVGDAISAVVAGNQTLTDAAALFTSAADGQYLNIAGSVASNNGNKWVQAFTSSSVISFENAGGVVDAAYAGAWTLPGVYTQITDLQSGLVFAQPTAVERPALVNAFSIPVLGKATNNPGAQSLVYTNAAISAFQGTDICFSARVRSGTLNPNIWLCQIDNGATNNRIRFSLSGSNLSMQWTAAGVSTTLAISCGLNANTWTTIGGRLNFSANTLTAYKQGVITGTSAPGTARNPTGLTSLRVGGSVVSAEEGFLSALAIYPGSPSWTDADFLAVHNLFLAHPVP